MVRTRKVTIRLTDGELHHLHEQASTAGMKVDPFVRNLIAGAQLKPHPPETYAGLLRELSAIGNNINQIARIANTCHTIDSEQVRMARIFAESAWKILKERL